MATSFKILNPASLENLLKAADKGLSSGDVFKEYGSSLSGGGSGSAESQIDAKARSLVEKSTDLTIEKARAKVMNDNPELYTQYLLEG